jgi:flagellar biosynthetic protein FlhB
MADKTEPPSNRRLEEAREEGNVARSLELNTAVIILASAFFIRGQGGQLVDLLKDMMVLTIQKIADAEMTGTWLRSFAFSEVMVLGPRLLFIFAGFLVCGVTVTLVQTNFLWASKKIGFDFKRLNPLDGFKRIFSSQGLIEFARSLLKLGLIGYVVYVYLRDNYVAILETGQISLNAAVERWASLSIDMIIRAGSAYMVLAVADYAFQRWQFMRKLRMTKEEVKEEFKRSEGDPFLRGRIRAQQRKIARTRMMSNVHKAKVVITNPTHFAVALDYQADSMHAPKVLAKGAFHVAQKIVDIARENNIPVVQNVPLARALYKAVEVDQEIPPAMYVAVAEVLAYVYRLRQPAPLRRAQAQS